jgi:hypothetical protein
MENTISFVKDVRIPKGAAEPHLMAIKARGTATIRRLVAPVLIPREYPSAPPDGIFELDITLDESHQDFTDVDLEVEVFFRIKNLPDWVNGVKVNASNNSGIELL